VRWHWAGSGPHFPAAIQIEDAATGAVLVCLKWRDAERLIEALHREVEACKTELSKL